jgi:hypothetical protein
MGDALLSLVPVVGEPDVVALDQSGLQGGRIPYPISTTGAPQLQLGAINPELTLRVWAQ